MRHIIKNNLFINYLINGFDDKSLQSKDENSFVIIDDGKNSYQFKYINKNTLQVRFKDNMDVINIIKFYK